MKRVDELEAAWLRAEQWRKQADKHYRLWGRESYITLSWRANERRAWKLFRDAVILDECGGG